MFLMNHYDTSFIVKKMEIDRNHIDHFVLETEEGTKRMKDKFHRMACEQRNDYIENQKKIYSLYLSEIRNEISKRLSNQIPKDKNDSYTKDLLEVDRYLDLVILDSDVSSSFKLKIDYIIASITEDTSLEELNAILDSFIRKFKEFNIVLSIQDFCYTMFTERYMTSFFEKNEFVFLKGVFEKIYYACPDIILQLKRNLYYIVQKYQKELSNSVLSLKNSLFEKYHVSSSNVIDHYVEARFDVGNKMAMDPYNNSKVFLDGKKKISDYLDGSPVREKNYDSFTSVKYSSLTNIDKDNYNSAMMSFYVTLNELKKFYHYEFILKDLLERYQNKDSVKNNYLSKKKEIEKEEKVRLSLYKNYLKACGIGFLARKNDTKMNDLMLKMNEQIRKLHNLYLELDDLEITYSLISLNDSASIYDLFLKSLKSFSFLEKSFRNNEYFMENSLEENINQFIKFLFNPNNNFLRKINVFSEYDVTEVLAEKYRLLNINVTKEMILPDSIDATLDSVQFINLIQNIERSKISLSEISILCQFQDILSSN